MRHWKNIGALLALIGEVALQVSNYHNNTLAIALVIVMLGLLLWSAWPILTTTQLQSPIVRRRILSNGKESLLEQFTKDDKVNLGKRFYARDYSWSFDNLKETDSFIRMTVTIINASVFPILIESVKANNRFLIEGQECAYAAEMEGLARIPRGESGNIGIKQHISQEMMNLLLRHNMRKQAVKISLKSCKVIVRPEIMGSQSEPIDIGFAFDQDVPIPELKWE